MRTPFDLNDRDFSRYVHKTGIEADLVPVYASQVTTLDGVDHNVIALGRPFPNAERALESAIYAALSSQRVTFITQVYNPLVTINNLIGNIKKFGDASVAEKLRRTIADNAEGFIRLTREKSVICQCPDGSFSYGVIGTEHNGRIAQYAPVAIADEDEGTVDANGITVSGIYRNTCRILGIEDIPVFSPCDSALFLELLSAARVKPKLYEKPSWFEDYLV